MCGTIILDQLQKVIFQRIYNLLVVVILEGNLNEFLNGSGSMLIHAYLGDIGGYGIDYFLELVQSAFF